MTESQRQGWLAYLSRGYLGKETENAIAPVPLPIPKGPGLHRICEPIDASVECETPLVISRTIERRLTVVEQHCICPRLNRQFENVV